MTDSPKAGPDEGVWIHRIGGACPCQAFGTIDGNPFYFRARWGNWTFEIAPPGVDPVFPENPLYAAKGEDEYGGWMPAEEAAKIIMIHAMEFTKCQEAQKCEMK